MPPKQKLSIAEQAARGKLDSALAKGRASGSATPNIRSDSAKASQTPSQFD